MSVPSIASVYRNRLANACPDVGGPYLQADPTVQYARGLARRLVVEAAIHRRIRLRPGSIQHFTSIQDCHRDQSPAPAFRHWKQPSIRPGDRYCFFVATGEDGRHVFAQHSG